jgi:hypothetical protein
MIVLREGTFIFNFLAIIYSTLAEDRLFRILLGASIIVLDRLATLLPDPLLNLL